MIVTRTAPVRRLALRFSLRLLLAAVTVGCVALGYWKMQVYPYRMQNEAIRIFRDAGGTVSVRPAGPAWIRAMAGTDSLQTIVHVDLENCRVTDDCLAWLRRLPDLENCKIGRASPGAPLQPIDGGLADAEYLNLNDSPITDATMPYLAGCTKLETLFLCNTQVTDDGLESLKNVPSLRFVWLNGSRVTSAGARKLRASLPKAYVGY